MILSFSRKSILFSKNLNVEVFERTCFDNLLPKSGQENAYPTVFLHGLFGSKRNWNSFSRLFNETIGIETFCIDLPHHGNYISNSPTLSYDLFVDSILYFKKKYVQREKINLIGHSMGGKAACYMALKYPDLVNSLLLVDIVPWSLSRDLSNIPGIIETMNEVDFKNLNTRAEVYEFLKKNFNKEICDLMYSNVSFEAESCFWKHDVKIFRNNIENILGFPNIKSIYQGPSLLVYGGNSHYYHESDEKRLLEILPKVDIKVIENCGHLPHIEKKIELLEILKTFYNNRINLN